MCECPCTVHYWVLIFRFIENIHVIRILLRSVQNYKLYRLDLRITYMYVRHNKKLKTRKAKCRVDLNHAYNDAYNSMFCFLDFLEPFFFFLRFLPFPFRVFFFGMGDGLSLSLSLSTGGAPQNSSQVS